MTFSAGLFDELTPCYPDTEAGTEGRYGNGKGSQTLCLVL